MMDIEMDEGWIDDRWVNDRIDVARRMDDGKMERWMDG